MVARGLKRKLVTEDEGQGVAAWDKQLQSVLDISMEKFNQDQAQVEPCLLRSVLINNTLRQVQSEVRAQVQSLSCVKNPTVRNSPISKLELPQKSAHNETDADSEAEDEENDFMGWTSEEDFSLSSSISGILKDLDTTIDGPSHWPPLGSIENLTLTGVSLCPLGNLGPEKSTVHLFSSGKSKPGCPLLQDLTLEKVLLDINASILEPEENLQKDDSSKCHLPPLSKSPSTSSSTFAPSIPTQASWESQELEHVMDFLMQTYPQS